MAKNLEQIKTQIESRMAGSSTLRNVTHVGITVQSTGMSFWKKSSLKINGRVNKEEELRELNGIIAEEAEGLDVLNTVRVEYRS